MASRFLEPNPLIAREVKARWRDERSFSLVLLLASGLCLLFVWLYQTQGEAVALRAEPGAQWAMLGHELFRSLSTLQTLAWLLISPALSSSSIAYERERGWFDALLLSPLLPRQIALGKWVSALLFAAILYGITLPFALLTLLLGGVSPAEFWIALALHLLCAMLGAAVGLAASSWSVRSHVALRTALGLVLVWLLTSLAAASVSGDGPFSRMALSLLGPTRPSLFNLGWGHTNPILVALELGSGTPTPRFPLCFAFMGAATLFFLWVATHYSRRPLQEAPFIEARPKSAGKSAPTSTHGQIPLVTRLKFQNPVLDREVRAKFRMRQPPLAVIIVEGLLGVLVAFFYFRTLYMAIFDPASRFLVWWGLIFTALIVTMMAAAVMGGNGFSRERESGTWEGIRLSLLSPAEVISGKIWSPMLSCALFSLPVWPLLLPCISWGAGISSTRQIGPLQAGACLLIWAATAWSFSCVGLWIGQRQNRSARAAGQALGAWAAFLILSPALMLGSDTLGMSYVLGAIHPFVALIMALDQVNIDLVFTSGLPYFVFHLMVGCFFLGQVRRRLENEWKGTADLQSTRSTGPNAKI